MGDETSSKGKGEGQDQFFIEALDGNLTSQDSPFMPEVDSVYNDDGTPSGYDITFNQAFIFNRT